MSKHKRRERNITRQQGMAIRYCSSTCYLPSIGLRIKDDQQMTLFEDDIVCTTHGPVNWRNPTPKRTTPNSPVFLLPLSRLMFRPTLTQVCTRQSLNAQPCTRVFCATDEWWAACSGDFVRFHARSCTPYIGNGESHWVTVVEPYLKVTVSK